MHSQRAFCFHEFLEDAEHAATRARQVRKWKHFEAVNPPRKKYSRRVTFLLDHSGRVLTQVCGERREVITTGRAMVEHLDHRQVFEKDHFRFDKNILEDLHSKLKLIDDLKEDDEKKECRIDANNNLIEAKSSFGIKDHSKELSKVEECEERSEEGSSELSDSLVSSGSGDKGQCTTESSEKEVSPEPEGNSPREKLKKRESFWLRAAEEAGKESLNVVKSTGEVDYEEIINIGSVASHIARWESLSKQKGGEEQINKDFVCCLEDELKFLEDQPRNEKEILEWFKGPEMIKSRLFDQETKIFAPYFFGLVSRLEAERVLANANIGTYIVRLSNRIWGYALSYKCRKRCKHFLIEAREGNYKLLGASGVKNCHGSVEELLLHHTHAPLSKLGGEKLGQPLERNEGVVPMLP